MIGIGQASGATTQVAVMMSMVDMFPGSVKKLLNQVCKPPADASQLWYPYSTLFTQVVTIMFWLSDIISPFLLMPLVTVACAHCRQQCLVSFTF